MSWAEVPRPDAEADADKAGQTGSALTRDTAAGLGRSPQNRPTGNSAKELIGHLPGFVFRAAHDGQRLRFLYASPNCMELWGQSADHLNASAGGFADQIHAQDRDAFQAALQLGIDTGLWNWDGRIHTPHGLKWVNVRARVLRGEGALPESVGIMLNVSRLHQREMDLLDRSVALRDMATRLEAVREQERARLARNLHDDLGQVLTAMKMDIGSLRQATRAGDTDRLTELLGTLDRMVDLASDAGRRVAAELRPGVLDLGVEAALRWLTGSFAQRYGIAVTCDVDVAEPVDALVCAEVFRIAQEALTNIARHASARHAWLRLVRIDGQLQLDVEDDGRGMPEQEPAVAQRPTFGLRGMQERADLLGGDMVTSRSVHGGLHLQVRLPDKDVVHA